jgi:hypothetical protein
VYFRTNIQSMFGWLVMFSTKDRKKADSLQELTGT